MILSRIPFGYRGNWLPAGLNSVTAGIGWFAVNSVSGAFALNTLTHMPKWLSLLIIVVVQLTIAFFGHNLAHVVEKWALPVLGLAFLLAAISIFSKANASAPHGPNASFGLGGTGGFMLTLGGAFGYAVGWNPFASDYTRYMKPSTSKRAVGLFAGLGVFVSCVVLEMIGAASATIGKSTDALNNPTSAFTGHMSTALADFVLVAIAIGAVCANVLNIYSGAMSFLTWASGCRSPCVARSWRRSLAVIGFIVALTGLHDAGEKYTNFLLVIAYWIAPWLGVMFSDMLMRRRARVDGFLFDTKHNPWAGWVAMGVAMVVSIWLFSDQTKYLAPIPKAHPGLGDITFEVGFVIAAVLYAVFYKLQGGRKHPRRWSIPEYGAGADEVARTTRNGSRRQATDGGRSLVVLRRPRSRWSGRGGTSNNTTSADDEEPANSEPDRVDVGRRIEDHEVGGVSFDDAVALEPNAAAGFTVTMSRSRCNSSSPL